MASPRAPWLVSAALHAALLAAALVWLGSAAPRASGPVALRFLSAGAPENKAPAGSGSWWKDRTPAAGLSGESSAPAWASRSDAPVATPNPVQGQARLDELLGSGFGAAPAQETPDRGAAGTEGPETGWVSAAGEGYQAPPLPPPSLVPAGGAKWTLVIAVGAGGGPAEGVQGLESGHPDLDRWLEAYLRTASFPASLDGRDYQVRWVLRLEAGRPR